MHIEKIKNELASRVQQLMNQRQSVKMNNMTNRNLVRPWKEKIAETEDLVQKVYQTLHELLIQNQISFANDLEKEGFVSSIEPTIHDLVIRNIDD